MFMEIWKDIAGYEGYYQISSLGRVKSLNIFDALGREVKEKILKQKANQQGYLRVSLNKNNHMVKAHVHVLVAVAFLNHIPNKLNAVVDHKFNDKTDNKAKSLQIISHRLNTSKDRNNCSSKFTGVCFDKKMNKWKSYIKINKKRIHLGYFINEIDANNAYQNTLKEHLINF